MGYLSVRGVGVTLAALTLVFGGISTSQAQTQANWSWIDSDSTAPVEEKLNGMRCLLDDDPNDKQLPLPNNGRKSGVGLYTPPTADIDPNNIFIYVDGGGKCISADDCQALPPDHGSYNGDNFAVEKLRKSNPHIMPAVYSGWPNNPPHSPFEKMRRIFVPYCTGDQHSGLNTQDSSDGKTYHFVGRQNFEKVADFVTAYIATLTPKPKTIWLMGTSAGGGGALFNYIKLRETVNKGINVQANKVQVHLIEDSSPGLKEPYSVEIKKRDNWLYTYPCGASSSACSSLCERDPMGPDQTSICLDAPMLRTYIRGTYAGMRYGFMSFYFDSTAMGDSLQSVEDASTIIRGLMDTLVTSSPSNTHTFYADNDLMYPIEPAPNNCPRQRTHVVSKMNQYDAFRNSQINWLTAMVTNVGWGNAVETIPVNSCPSSNMFPVP